MEIIATREEVQNLLAKHPARSYLTFPEDRRYPIRMFDHLPSRWIERGPSQEFVGQAQPGEFYPFQIGIYAARQPVRRLEVTVSDLRGEGEQIDWQALGIRPHRCRITAPAVLHVQPPTRFSPDQPIPVPAGRGWLLVLEEERQ